MLLAATIRSGPLMFRVEVEPTAVLVPVGISWTYPDAVVLVAVMLPETALGGIAVSCGSALNGTSSVAPLATTPPVTRVSRTRVGGIGMKSPVVADGALVPVK